MKMRIILGVLASAAVLPSSAMAAGLPKFHSKLIVPGKSVGGVSLGEGAAKAIKTWGGNTDCTAGPTLTECMWGSDANGTTGSISLSFASGKVTHIDIQLNANTHGAAVFKGVLMSLKTKSGIGLKSDVAQLEKAYSGKVGANGLGYTLGSGAHTTTFATSAGKFVSIAIGTPPNV